MPWQAPVGQSLSGLRLTHRLQSPDPTRVENHLRVIETPSSSACHCLSRGCAMFVFPPARGHKPLTHSPAQGPLGPAAQTTSQKQYSSLCNSLNEKHDAGRSKPPAIPRESQTEGNPSQAPFWQAARGRDLLFHRPPDPFARAVIHHDRRIGVVIRSKTARHCIALCRCRAISARPPSISGLFVHSPLKHTSIPSASLCCHRLLPCCDAYLDGVGAQVGCPSRPGGTVGGGGRKT